MGVTVRQCAVDWNGRMESEVDGSHSMPRAVDWNGRMECGFHSMTSAVVDGMGAWCAIFIIMCAEQ